ncbi:MAG TPA: RICIN domain-containing protein [Longimicrobium sp.]|nr:RICIN domain-containing protein [Longimicrobium sp.]
MSRIGRRAFARTLLLASGLVFAGACDNLSPTVTATPPETAQLSIDPTAWYVIRNVSTNKVMDVENAGCCNGYWVHQWTYENRSNQQWQIVPVGGGYYRVVARHSGRVLDVKGASMGDGARVHQWGYDGSTNQQFYFLPHGSGNNNYIIVARHSQKALEVNGGLGFTGNINDNGVGIRQYGQVTRGVWKLELVQ